MVILEQVIFSLKEGKTTFIESLSKVKGFRVFVVEEKHTKTKVGKNLLDGVYQYPDSYSYVLNDYILRMFHNELKSISDKIDDKESTLILVDRSLASNVDVFSKMHLDNKNMSESEFDELVNKRKTIEKYLSENFGDFAVVNAFLNTSIDDCYDNIQKRMINEGRECENKIDKNIWEEWKNITKN